MTEIIHIKLEYDESLQAKKDILNSELGLLKVAKAIKKHQILRSDELKIKLRLYKKLKELKANIRKLQYVLPKIKIPEILKEKEENSEEKIIKPTIEKRAHDNSLETQLQEIQERLRQLD